jgi:hypothetical protein
MKTMNQKKTAMLLATLGGLLISQVEAGDADVENAIAEAQAAIEKADAVGYAWRDSSKLLKAAEEAAANGKHEQALELAATAKFQGEAAYAQYEDNKDAGPNF